MDRLFLDANVLFSAAYREESGLLRLWKLESVELVTSSYAVEEARRNLNRGPQRECLGDLTVGIRVVTEVPRLTRPLGVELAEKDAPILAAAVACQATHLLTGDRRHFGHLFGKRVSDVLVLTPRGYLDLTP